MQNRKVIASAIISELQSSDMYISVRGRLCDLRTNANGVAVTEAFIDEIVANEEKYIGIPLCADVRGLLNDRNIGHMYNRATGEFMSAIVGSMIHFEKEVEDGNASLIINARVMKRYKAVCAAIARLFAENRLKFSFEIACGDYTELDDGTMLIDASDLNYLEGAAIVTFPACEDAVAMELVAECLGKEGESMADEDKVVSSQETEVANAEEEVASEEIASEEKETEVASEETESSAEATAEIIVREVQHTENHVYTCDTDTGEETRESIEHTVEVVTPVVSMAEDMPDDNDEEKEDREEECAETPVEPELEEAEKEKKEKCAEVTEETADIHESQLAEIMESIRAIQSELAAIKEHYETASVNNETAEEAPIAEEVVAENTEKKWTLISPFTSTINVPNKYGLLEREEAHSGEYKLLRS